MKMYAYKIYEQGSIAATDTEISNTFIKRPRGQRYQILSILRAAKDSNVDPEVMDAVQSLLDDIADKIKKDGYAVIEWAVKTENPVTYKLEDGTLAESKRRWADYDDRKLDMAILAFMKEPDSTGGAGPIPEVVPDLA